MLVLPDRSVVAASMLPSQLLAVEVLRRPVESTVLVDVRVMPPAERAQILERRRATARPRHDVMTVDDSIRAPREPAAAIPEAQRPTQHGRDRSPAPPDVEHVSAGILDDLDDARIAEQALRRGGRQCVAVVEHTWSVRLAERRRVDVDDDFDRRRRRRGTTSEVLLGDRDQRVDTTERRRRRFRGNVRRAFHRRLDGPPHDGRLVGPELHVQAHEAVFGLALAYPPIVRLVLGPLVDRVPHCETVTAADPLELRRRRRACHVEQRRFCRGGRDARERADFRVADLSAGESDVDERQVGERARDADVLARGAEVEADPPREPVRAREGALIGPAAGFVEPADERQQAMGGRVEVRGELGDLVAEAIGVGGGAHGAHRTTRLRGLAAARWRGVQRATGLRSLLRRRRIVGRLERVREARGCERSRSQRVVARKPVKSASSKKREISTSLAECARTKAD